MAKQPKALVGLDIDPVGICAAQITVDGEIVVQRAASAPLEPGIIRDGEIADVEALADALKGLFAHHKGLDKRVRIGVANQKVVVRTIELPPIDDPKELDAAVRFQAQDAIPMPLDQAVLDWQALDIVDTENGPRQRVLIAAARRDMIDRVMAAGKGAGLRIEGIDLGAFAMIRALHGSAPSDQVTLYAQIAGITNVAVARGQQCLFARASGTGAEGLAVELAERRGLTLEHARAWLGHVGLHQPIEHVEGDREIVAESRRVLEEGVRRIAAEIRQSLDFHHMQADGAHVTRAVITGAAAAIPGFTDAIGAELGLACAGAAVAGDTGEIAAAEVTIAAGLAAPGAPAVNLLPPEERRAAGTGGRSGGAVYGVLGALGIGLVLLTILTLAGNGVKDKQAEVASLTQQADQAEATARGLQAYTSFAQLREKRLQTVKSLADSRFDWSGTLNEVSRTLPSDVWLVSLDGNVGGAGGAGGAGTAAAGPTVKIVGCTTTQVKVASMMSALRRIDGVTRVSLASSEKADDGGGGSGGGEGGGSAADCRNGSDQYPKFEMTIYYAALPGATAAGAAAGGATAADAGAGATSGATTGPTGPAGSTAAPADGAGAAPATGTETTGAGSTGAAAASATPSSSTPATGSTGIASDPAGDAS